MNDQTGSHMHRICRELVQLKRELEHAGDDDTRQSIRKSIVERLWQFAALVDDDGSVGNYYSFETERAGVALDAAPAGVTAEDWEKQHSAESAARLLLDLSGTNSPFWGSHLARGIGGVFAHVVDLLRGLKPEPLIAPPPRNNQQERKGGNRSGNLLHSGSRRMLAQIIHFKAGRDNLTLSDAFEQLNTGWDFKNFQDSQVKFIDRASRNKARSCGKLVRSGARMESEPAALAEQCLTFLEDREKLAQLVSDAFRVRAQC